MRTRRRGERIDYLTFHPDGEPCLDMGLGGEIDQLRPLGVPIAVISNGTEITRRAQGVELLLEHQSIASIESIARIALAHSRMRVRERCSAPSRALFLAVRR